MNEIASNATQMDAFREWLAGLDRRGKRVLLTALGVFSSVWLSGALLAPNVVAGIERLPPLMRVAAALCFGGFAWPWLLLERNGSIVESVQRPHLLWIPLAGVLPGIVGLAIWLLSQEVDPLTLMKRRIRELDRSQGHISADELAKMSAVDRGVPLAIVTTRKGKKVRVGLEIESEGHVCSFAPTGRGKSLHLTDVLLSYPGAALVVDPKGEMLKRTAATRSNWGPIYRFPGHEICLADYYDRLLDRDSVSALHEQLVRPWQDRERVFADKSLSLFTAAGLYAEAKGLDPLRVLLDLAESDPVQALAGLEQVPAARRHVRIFTNGATPNGFQDDRFATSAFGTFTTRLSLYQKHVDTIAPLQESGTYDRRRLLDPDWIRRRGTIYLNYDLPSMAGAGGVVAAIIAGIARQHVREQKQLDPGGRPPLERRALFAVDELAHVGIGELNTYLTTVRSAGIMFLLYIQNVKQLDALYGTSGTEILIDSCDHQLWYPPNLHQMGERQSELYGKTFRSMPTHSASQGMRSHRNSDGQATTQTSTQQGASTVWREAPHLTAAQFVALPRDQVLVKVMAKRDARRRRRDAPPGESKDPGSSFVFIGQRLNPIDLLDSLPGPELLHLPAPRSGERVYIDWTAAPEGRQTGRSSAEEEVASAGTDGALPGARAGEEADAPGAAGGEGERGAGEGREGGADGAASDEADESGGPEIRGMF